MVSLKGRKEGIKMRCFIVIYLSSLVLASCSLIVDGKGLYDDVDSGVLGPDCIDNQSCFGEEDGENAVFAGNANGVVSLGLSEVSTDDDSETDSDVDSDTETVNDLDTLIDVEIDTGTGDEVDTDTDSDDSSDSETDVESDSEDVGSDSDTESESGDDETDDTGSTEDTDVDSETGTDIDGDADTDADTDADGDGDSDVDSDGDADSDSDSDSDADSDADTDADSDSDSDSDTDADADTDDDCESASLWAENQTYALLERVISDDVNGDFKLYMCGSPACGQTNPGIDPVWPTVWVVVEDCGDVDTGSDTGSVVVDTDTETDSDSDTVVDHECYDGQGATWSDDDNGLMWQLWRDAEKRSYDGSVSYCENMVCGGHDDWRVPNLYERATLIRDCPYTEPGGLCYTNESVCSQCDGYTEDALGGATGFWDWTSTTISFGGTIYRRTVDYSGRVSHSNPLEDENAVRCVRSI